MPNLEDRPIASSAELQNICFASVAKGVSGARMPNATATSRAATSESCREASLV